MQSGWKLDIVNKCLHISKAETVLVLIPTLLHGELGYICERLDSGVAAQTLGLDDSLKWIRNQGCTATAQEFMELLEKQEKQEKQDQQYRRDLRAAREFLDGRLDRLLSGAAAPKNYITSGTWVGVINWTPDGVLFKFSNPHKTIVLNMGSPNQPNVVVTVDDKPPVEVTAQDLGQFLRQEDCPFTAKDTAPLVRGLFMKTPTSTDTSLN